MLQLFFICEQFYFMINRIVKKRTKRLLSATALNTVVYVVDAFFVVRYDIFDGK